MEGKLTAAVHTPPVAEASLIKERIVLISLFYGKDIRHSKGNVIPVFFQKEQICVRTERQNHRQKGVIKFCEHEFGEYISPIFLRPKSDGSYRLILNLKELNSHLESIHFKMDNINSVLKLITQLFYE